MPTKGELEQQLEEAQRQLREAQEGAGATGTDSTASSMMMQFFAMMREQQERTEDQIRAQREAAEKDRNLLLGQIDKLMGELVDAKKRRTSDTTSRTPKPVPPPKLLPDITVAKLKAWRKAWNDYAHICRLDKMDLDEPQEVFRRS